MPSRAYKWWLLGVSLALNAIVWVLAGVIVGYGGSARVLHYTAGLGIDFIGEGRTVFWVPLIGLILLVFNLLVGLGMQSADRRVTWVLWATTPWLQLLLIITMGWLLRLNL